MAIDTEKMKALAAKAREESVALMNSFSEDVFGTLYEAADAIDTLLAALEAAAADKRELFALLPGPYYMDPPDGGDVSLIEQLRRMAKDAERYRWLRDEDAGVPDGEREMCVVQFRLPFTEDPDRDLFDVALDAAIDKALSQRQEES
ncbi:hypothetical protein KTD09_29590 [Burkholderia multivorans]|uniref:hypothetical protein n=1 Tax=Burkholderia multivorans TaxID=87883 RepID=UPI001C227D68|nr:hypothetical protein [Burkholderia multivorans]MBU9318989.1 hypothetical protein [Burkholderia multivorans]